MPLDGDIKQFSPQPDLQDPVCRVLMDAIRLIRERGWTRFQMCDSSGRLCIHGALRAAAYGDPYGGVGALQAPEYSAACAAIGRVLRAPRGRLNHAEWNNAPGRTAAEVISALEGAARSLAAQNMSRGE